LAAERLGKNKGHARACLFCFIVWIFTLVQDATSEDLERTADAGAIVDERGFQRRVKIVEERRFSAA
jgi:hypothetical protein